MFVYNHLKTVAPNKRQAVLDAARSSPVNLLASRDGKAVQVRLGPSDQLDGASLHDESGIQVRVYDLE